MKLEKRLNLLSGGILLLALIVLIAGNSCASRPAGSADVVGKVYYVSTSGNDENPGTGRRSAFLTLQKAADVMVAGDTCFVSGEIYRETVKLKHSGTRAKPIVFAAAPRAVVTLSGTDLITRWGVHWGDPMEKTFRGRTGKNVYTQLYVEDELMTAAGSLEAVDGPGKWFMGDQAVYLWPPDRPTPTGLGPPYGSPVEQYDVEGKVRDYIFDVSDVDNVVLSGFNFFATTGTSDDGKRTIKLVN